MKKLRILALVMVFAIAALGGAYAMWYDSLFINETVNTGLVDVKWQDPISSDEGPNYTGYNNNVFGGNLDRLDPGNPNEAKNVGAKDATLADDNEELPPIASDNDPRAEDDVLNITLTNGYPGYQEFITTAIFNAGTVPVKFYLEAVEGSEVPDWMHVQIKNADDGTVYYDSIEGCVETSPQLDPGDCINIQIIERILQEAPQLATWEGSFKIKAVQWNEYDFQLPNEITSDIIAY